ncbi:MAG TPA: GON domain-containing protein [Polyangiaceae bacterium]|nr:GON domain-containing protein [Polyangiaceae bacterium]
MTSAPTLASRFALCLSIVAPLMTGCAADEGAAAADEAVGEVEQALLPPPPPPPASCQDIRHANPNARDGHYALHIGHDPAKRWTAYCHTMASSPAEYLTLPNVGAAVNFSQYTAGGAVSGSSVRTNYSKVRVDPATLLVDIGDQTFSTSSGQLTHGGEAVTSMPFGVGMSCDASPSGVGNIDLRGTPFAVAAGEFLTGGAASSGSAVYSSDNRVVDLSGGGYCGWICASPATFNPFNDAGDFQLALEFAP